MKAIILAAGAGSRLGELTKDCPKPLIKIGEKSLLEHQISKLKKNNINEIFVIVGPYPEKYTFDGIEYIIDKNFKEHDQFGSLLLSKSLLTEEIIIIFADIIFDEIILKQILNSKNNFSISVDLEWKNSYTIRTNNDISDADVSVISNNEISKIGRNSKFLHENVTGEFLGIIKISNSLIKKFQNDLEIFERQLSNINQNLTIKNAKVIDFLEFLLDNGTKISPEFISGKWSEIDTKQDLEIAIKKFQDS